MKILVDEMPKNIVACMYSDYEPFAYSGYYMCIYQKPAELYKGTDKCPFFMSFKDYMNRPVVGIDKNRYRRLYG